MTAPVSPFQPIVERLRHAAEPPKSLGVLPTRALYGEAADRIEELERDLSEWKQAASVEAGLRREFCARVEDLEAKTSLVTFNEACKRIEELENGFRDIMKATVEGRVCDDVAWFDSITTLHDFCDLVLNGPDPDTRADLPQRFRVARAITERGT